MKHFLKHNDESRLDPVRILKSLVFQLALQLPAVAEYIVKLKMKDVHLLRDAHAAYDLLLARRVLDIIGGQEVIILIDALDEGDPQHQQPVGNKVPRWR